MITLPRRAAKSRHARPCPEKCGRITGRQGDDIRHSAFIINDKLARMAV